MESASASESESVGLGLFLTEELWKENKNRGWATLAALLLILVWQFGKWLFTRLCRPPTPCSLTQSGPASMPTSTSAPTSTPATNFFSPPGISDLISEADLKGLIDSLDERDEDNEKWENVIEKCSNDLMYKAKCCKRKHLVEKDMFTLDSKWKLKIKEGKTRKEEEMKKREFMFGEDGPPKYLSLTLFEDCSPEILRDFYMDNDFRKQWDKTLIGHEQLHVDETTGLEIGRTIKKFPLLTPREYVLAWRVWEGKNNVFYCFIKECDHPLAPRSRKYVRVERFRSGWRIRQVPGTNVCEVKMVHQEDAGFNIEMAKLAFAKGIWSYVCKMDNALRKYCLIKQDQSGSAVPAVTYIQRVPAELEVTDANIAPIPPLVSMSTGGVNAPEDEENAKEVKKMPSKRLIANGLLLLGGLIYLSNTRCNLGAKVAVAFIWKKLSKRAPSSHEARTET